MALIEWISIIISAIVAIVALITAYINFLNYKAITSFTIYLRAETKQRIIDQNTSWGTIPNRIAQSLSLNNFALSSPQNHPITVIYFDVFLGNTGPGVAKRIHWKVEYSPKSQPTFNSYQDSNDMHSNIPFDLGPQSNIVIVGYLARDASMFQQSFSSQLSKLPNPTGHFPWLIELEYEMPTFCGKHKKSSERWNIENDGKCEKLT
jgi:hypothetical protein